MPSRSLLLAAVAACLAVPAAQAHGVAEAQGLEVHVLDDEGSDAIEPYGGYDIEDLFLGSAHVDGADAVYVRLVLYGEHAAHTATMPWRVEVSYLVGGERQVHTLSTVDGAVFTHDFAGLDFEYVAEEHELDINRAILSNGAPRPGEPLDGLEVRSYWGDDLRDVAPGGIPVPGTNGALDYDDPLAIDGQGRLQEHPVPAPVDAYFGPVAATRNGTAIALSVANGLSGGQHVHVAPAGDPAGWAVTVTPDNQVLEGNATGVFGVEAVPAEGAGPLDLELLSDVGGRLLVSLHPDGSVHARGEQVLAATPPAPPKESPGLPLAGLAATLALVLALRRK